MYKRIVAVLIGCAMLCTMAMTGCNISNTNTDTQNNSATQEGSANSENAEQTDDTPQENTEATTTEATQDVVADEEGTFVYVDETVTNPTVAPIDIPEDEEATALTEVTPQELAGTWMPLVATTVADGTEVPFSQAFGSAYSQYGGSLVIAEDASFTISMGASIIEAKSSGTFTISQNNLLVTYSGGDVDTFLYIPKYRNQQVIKTQIGSNYVYFYKEA